MNRYLTTLGRFWSASIGAEMEYRLNFLSSTLSSVMTLTGSLFTLWLLFRGDYQPGGFSWHEAVLVVGMFTILEGLQSALMNPNRMLISEAVREGTLDHVLLKPIDSQFWLSVRRFSPWGLPNVALGLGLVAYSILGGHVTATALGVVTAAAMLASGVLLLYCLGYALATLSIWFVKLYNVTMAMQALLEAGRYPVSAYPAAYRVFFTFVLPVAFMTTVPARAVTGDAGADWLLGSAVVTGGAWLFTRWWWRFALRSYTSASS